MRVALRNSLVLAALTIVIATPLGVGLALGLTRWRSRPAKLANGVLLLPLITPELVIGTSLFLVVTNAYDFIELGRTAQLVGHVTFSLTYVVIVVRGRLLSIGPDLEEAARDLGAAPLQAVRLVVLPLLTPAIFAAAVLVFATSIDDFVVSALLSSGASTETVPVRIYGSVRGGATPALNALATVMLAASAARAGGRVRGDAGDAPPPGRRAGRREQPQRPGELVSAADNRRALRVVRALADLSPAEEQRRLAKTIPLDWFHWLPLTAAAFFRPEGEPTVQPNPSAEIDEAFGERLAAVEQVRLGQRLVRVGFLFVAGPRVFHPLLTVSARVVRRGVVGGSALAPTGEAQITELVDDLETRARLEAEVQYGGGALDEVRTPAAEPALLARLPQLAAFAREPRQRPAST